MTPRIASTTAKTTTTTTEQVISYKDICQEFKNQFKNSSKTKKNCIDLFYLNSKFIKTITQAFGFKKEKTVKKMLCKWNKKVKNQIQWGQDEKMIEEEEKYLIKRIHIKEMIKLINMAQIVKNEFKMGPEIGFAFCLGVLYATLVFEGTSMDLTITEIYGIIPKNKRQGSSFKQFQEDFFIKGTSNKINKILYNN